MYSFIFKNPWQKNGKSMEENITRKVKLKENVKYYEDFFSVPWWDSNFSIYASFIWVCLYRHKPKVSVTLNR